MSSTGSKQSLKKVTVKAPVIPNYRIHLDKNDYRKSFLSDDSIRSQAITKLMKVCRDISSALNTYRHWAWLVITDRYYLIIEYGTDGIVVSVYEKATKSLDDALSIVMGDGEVYLEDEYTTNENVGTLFDYVIDLHTIYPSEKYNAINHNCREFFLSLGREIFGEDFWPIEEFVVPSMIFNNSLCCIV